MQNIIARVYDYCASQGLLDIDAIIVGVSGGPDSMALLSILHELSTKVTDFPKLYAVHVNHLIREDATKDQNLVERFCESLEIPEKTYSFDVVSLAEKSGKSLEEMGRLLRYKAFDEYAAEIYGDNYKASTRIAVAHHRGDVSETMLMNLFRGTGLEGMVSPKSIADRVIRPLLCLCKAEIVSYLEEKRITFATDYTNFETDCTRNVWRNEIIPAISKVSVKSPEVALNDTYNLLKTDLDFIEGVVDKIYNENKIVDGKFTLLPIDVIKNEHVAISSRLIRKLRNDNYGNLVDFGSIHLENVRFMINSSSMETNTIDMPFDTLAFVVSGFAGFCKDESDLVHISRIIADRMGVLTCEGNFSINIDVNDHNFTKLPNSNISIIARKFENNCGLEYNNSSWFVPIYDEESKNITVANNLSQVKFTRAGSKSGKLLAKVMSDMHIPRLARSYVLGVQYGDDYLWVPGIGHTNGFLSFISHNKWEETNKTPSHYIKIEIVGGE